jgi:hypothetical protein
MNLMPEIIDSTEENINASSLNNNIEDKDTEDILPEPITKEIIPTNEIFKDAPPPVIAKPKRTRKMTPAALESLSKARAKAMETKKRNKELRLKGEMLTPTEHKKKVKEEQEEKKRPIVNNVVHKTENITNTITHEDIQNIVEKSTAKTLDDYETKRKARKQEKKLKNIKETQQKEVKNTIQKAMGYKMGEEGFYGSCF